MDHTVLREDKQVNYNYVKCSLKGFRAGWVLKVATKYQNLEGHAKAHRPCQQGGTECAKAQRDRNAQCVCGGGQNYR